MLFFFGLHEIITILTISVKRIALFVENSSFHHIKKIL